MPVNVTEEARYTREQLDFIAHTAMHSDAALWRLARGDTQYAVSDRLRIQVTRLSRNEYSITTW